MAWGGEGTDGYLDFRPDRGTLDGQVQQHPPGRSHLSGSGLGCRGIAGFRIPGPAAPAALQATAVLVAQQDAADPTCSERSRGSVRVLGVGAGGMM